MANGSKFPKTNALIQPNTTPTEVAKVHAIRGWRRLLLLPLGWFVRGWGATLRIQIDAESLKHLGKTDEPIAFALWHNRLFLVSELFRRFRKGRPVYGLVSASKDGAWLDAFFSIVGMRCVRGSSSRLGREAVTALVTVLKEGNDIGITPDGPRGPKYDFKAGGIIVARRAHAPVVLVGAEFSSAWQLRSWDRFYLPKPFSKIRIRCEFFSSAQLNDRDDSVHRLRDRLLAINPD